VLEEEAQHLPVVSVLADRCRSAVLGGSKSGPSRNGFWPAARQGCTPSSRSRDACWDTIRRYPIRKVTTPVPVEGGVEGGALPMSAGTSFHGRRKPKGSACQRRTMMSAMSPLKSCDVRSPSPSGRCRIRRCCWSPPLYSRHARSRPRLKSPDQGQDLACGRRRAYPARRLGIALA
jgi:hypothetical protein